MAKRMHTAQFAKPRPAKLERADRKTAREKADKAESDKVKARSGGRCEMRVDRAVANLRCQRRAVHIHHMIGGWGKRARGISTLAANKLHLCNRCHSDIHAHVLVPDGDHFRRVT